MLHKGNPRYESHGIRKEAYAALASQSSRALFVHTVSADLDYYCSVQAINGRLAMLSSEIYAAWYCIFSPGWWHILDKTMGKREVGCFDDQKGAKWLMSQYH